jgi:hypothetical protein
MMKMNMKEITAAMDSSNKYVLSRIYKPLPPNAMTA